METFEWQIFDLRKFFFTDQNEIKIKPAKMPVCKVHNHEIGLRPSLERDTAGAFPGKIIATVCCKRQLIENDFSDD